MGSVDAEVTCVNMETLGHGFEQFWVVDGSLLHEEEQLVLSSHTLLSEVIQLDSELVVELTFLRQVVGIVSVIEVLSILGQRMEELVFSPGCNSVSCEGGHLNLSEFTTSKEIESSQLVLEVLEVPNSWPPDYLQLISHFDGIL